MTTFTIVHVLISLAAIAAGFVVLAGLINAKPLKGWTAFFLSTTVATSVTGFFFPFHKLTPAHVVGIISLVALALAIFALYQRKLLGPWRWIYVASAVLSLYLNFFVLIVQLFQKVSVLRNLAPTQTEPPFVIAQSSALLMFVALGIASAIRFRPPLASA